MALLIRLASCASVLAFAGVACAQTAPAPLTAPAKPAAAPTTNAPAPVTSAPVMSESKFLGVLYSEIEKHTPVENTLGDGEVTASFHVNAAGRIDKVVIDKTTSPALADAVKQILGAVAAPPPPGGSMDVGQTFKFHKPEPEEVAPASAPAATAVTSKPAPALPARP